MRYSARLLTASLAFTLAACSQLPSPDFMDTSEDTRTSALTPESDSSSASDDDSETDLIEQDQLSVIAQPAAAPADADAARHPGLVAAQQSDAQYIDRLSASETPSAANQSDLWWRLRSGFKLDLSLNNPRIQVQLDWYARHQSYLDRTFKRSSLYLHFIVSEAEKRGIPTELALLPVVESAFDPFAYSHGRAAGIWQFIPGTGKHYGLRQTWWYDGRRDIVASTQAAFNYLEDMHRFFNGDWLLALASYNSGAGTVQRAIRKNRARGKPTDFWNLDLPRETRAYVPKLLAISKLVADPGSHGVTLFPIDNTPYFDVVELESQIDLAQAARLAGMDVDDLYILNPGYNQWATDPVGPHRLVLPVDLADTFRQAYDNLPPGQRVNWTRYKVRRGDSLISIAKKFNTTPLVLRDVNHIRGNLIREGQQLLIPSSYEQEDFYALSADNRLASKQAVDRGSAGTARIEYTVQSGDTLWDISREYRVNVRKLAKWNGMAPGDVLSPGKKLVIWTSKPVTTTPNPIAKPGQINNREIIRKVGYRVRQGDSLYLIASKFNVSVNELAKWNGINRSSILRPGQRLNIYVDVTEIN